MKAALEIKGRKDVAAVVRKTEREDQATDHVSTEFDMPVIL